MRLATFNPRAFFGEMALLAGDKRSADAFAKGERVVLYSFNAGRFKELAKRFPSLGLKIYENLGRDPAARLQATSSALRALE